MNVIIAVYLHNVELLPKTTRHQSMLFAVGKLGQKYQPKHRVNNCIGNALTRVCLIIIANFHIS